MNKKLMNRIKNYINELNLGVVYTDKSFKDITTLKVGGHIRLLYYPNNIESLKKIIHVINVYKIKWYVVGNGSNVFSNDKEFKGIIICLKKMEEILEIKQTKNNEYLVTVNSGMNISKLSCELVKRDLSGIESLSLIPATIGGIVTMNASCFNVSASDVVKSCYVYDGNKFRYLDNEELAFSYRNSLIKDNKYIILNVTLKVVKSNRYEITRLIKYYKDLKQSIQPMNLRSAGSVFKNTKEYNAWKVINDLGLRGYRVGGASISFKHCNFIINDGTSTSKDIQKLLKIIKKSAKEKKNINLESEWIFINF